MARAVRILSGDSERVLLGGEPALDVEIHFELVAGAELAQFGVLDAGVRAVDIHADTGADQNSDHRVGLRLMRMRGPSGHLLPRGPKARAATGGSVSGAGASGVS